MKSMMFLAVLMAGATPATEMVDDLPVDDDLPSLKPTRSGLRVMSTREARRNPFHRSPGSKQRKRRKKARRSR
jgi:hypothetical protein